MKKLAKISLIFTLFAAAVMPAFAQNKTETASAASAWLGTATGYTKASDVKYVTSGKYRANWGARDEACVFLTSYATDFYTGSYTYDQLALKAGSTNANSVPSSALYKALNQLVTSKQTSTTSYGDTREMYRYTDCVNSNYSYISSFYSGAKLNGAWDSGNTWNREHTWPNSKGDANGQGENDIMMLRPTATSENGSRGNKAYGESSGFYDPNSEGQNVRGDCARIILYVYTRWGTANMWSASGVMESKEILLKWMEEDPVDTWEMGRNDATQAIIGTRNVYVDYPEFAWMLFGEEAPDDMVTPSGKASNGMAKPSTPSTPTPDPDEPGDGEVTTPTTPTTQKEIVEAAYALGTGETLGEYTLTGKITNVKEYDSATTNICLTMQVEGKDFYCHWMRDNANGDNANLAVGDTITVTGTIKNYKDTVEFDKPNLGTVVKAGNDTPTPDPDTPVTPDPDTPVNPDPSPDVTPDPVTSGLEEGKAYVVTANNVHGVVYLMSGITTGRFNGSANDADAIYVYAENVDGGQLLYTFPDGNTKTYFVVNDKSQGADTTTDASAATVFEWNDSLKTLVVADDNNNRALALDSTKDFTTFSTYDVQNKYSWGQFTLVKAAQPETPDTPDTPDTPVNPDPETPVDPDTPDTPVEPDTPNDGDSSEEAFCPHKYSDWEVVTPATEETEGLERHACRHCGKTEERVIPALNADSESADSESADENSGDEMSDMLASLTVGCEASIGLSMVGMALLTAGFALLKRKDNE